MQTLKITFILMIKFYPKSHEPLNFLEWLLHIFINIYCSFMGVFGKFYFKASPPLP